MKPQRIQSKRSKGWKMPVNTINIARPGRWGNPFIVGKHGGVKYCVKLFQYLLAGYVAILDEECIKTQKRFLENFPQDIKKLRGKNLACWCKLSQPCHGDILLEIANK